MKRSRKTPPRLKFFCATRSTLSNAIANAVGSRTSAIPMPPPARRALEHHGVSNPLGFLPRLLEVCEQRAAGEQRDSRVGRNLTRPVLQAEVSDLRRCRTHEHDAGCRTGFGECGTFAQESVARMDCLGAAR